MKHIILPALSLVLLAAVPTQAQTSAQPYLQIAQQDNRDRAHSGGAHPSPAVVPAGGVGRAPAPSNADRTRGTGQAGGTHSTGGAGQHGAGAGGATATGGRHRGAGTGGAATTGGTLLGGRQTGGTGSTGGSSRGGVGGQGSILQPAGRTPVGGHGTGGAATGGAHANDTAFGTRPSNWNQYPRTFDRGTYQRNTTASRHFHWQSYNQPSGYYYRRWTFGQVLPSIFWAQDYWLTDYWMFDLPVPPYGYVWVRYNDDALLVNNQTGEVLQVVYGLFD